MLVLVPGLACRAREGRSTRRAQRIRRPPPPSRSKRLPFASRNLESLASAPGHTVALVQQKIRVPFAGTLVTLSVADGDRVRRGEVVGTIVSRDSEAALSGAREMEREANTPAEQ